MTDILEADCDCACHTGGAFRPACSVPGGCGPHEEPRCGLACAYDDGPCQRCVDLTTHDLAALDPLHDRLGADHDGALIPAMGRQPVMRALNLRGPGAAGSVKIRMVAVWRTRRSAPVICSAGLGIEEKPAFTLPVPWQTWVREPVIDEATGEQLWVEDGDQDGETPIPALLEDWVRECRYALHLASWPRDRTVGETVRWLSIQFQRWLDHADDPVQVCEEIRRAANSARSALRDFDPRPRLLYGVACPGREGHPCEALALYEQPDGGPIDCESCGMRFSRDDERIAAAIKEVLLAG